MTKATEAAEAAYELGCTLIGRPNGATFAELSALFNLCKPSTLNRVYHWCRKDWAVTIRWPLSSSPAIVFSSAALRDDFLQRMGPQQPSHAEVAMQMVRDLKGQPLTYDAYLAASQGYPRDSTGTLCQLAKSGRIVAIRVGRDMAYFETHAHANAWLDAGNGPRHMPRARKAAAAPPKPQKLRVQPGKPGHLLVVKERPSVPAGVTIRRPDPVVEVDASGAKITRDLARWPVAKWDTLQLAPDPRFPAFASMPLGALAG